MYHAVQKFVERLTEDTGQDGLQQSMADITAALDLSWFALSCPCSQAERVSTTDLNVSVVMDGALYATPLRTF
ncbi:hypothetical protein BaraCB756_10080 [Bradyrhizobium arachidis]|nr:MULTISPECIES: hypothetical protein [Bradyrhizobium]UFW54111.1 hypothetical protein BaraCB756_10080 [Bradyrhizobium arachidis]